MVSVKARIASTVMPMSIPIEPTIRSGLRPTLSTVKIATTVNTMFTMPITTVCSMETSPVAPMFSKILGA